MLLWSVGLYKVGRVLVLLLKGFNDTFRPGLGEFWPEDLRNDVSLCDVIYYGFGNILNHTYAHGTPGSTWAGPWIPVKSPSKTVSWRETGMFGPRDV